MKMIKILSVLMTMIMIITTVNTTTIEATTTVDTTSVQNTYKDFGSSEQGNLNVKHYNFSKNGKANLSANDIDLSDVDNNNAISDYNYATQENQGLYVLQSPDFDEGRLKKYEEDGDLVKIKKGNSIGSFEYEKDGSLYFFYENSRAKDNDAFYNGIVMWGYFVPKEDGDYTLGTITDDGVKGYLIDESGNEKTFANSWKYQSPTLITENKSVELKKNTLYPIYIEYFENQEDDVAFVLVMKKGNEKWTTVPSSYLYPALPSAEDDTAETDYNESVIIDVLDNDLYNTENEPILTVISGHGDATIEVTGNNKLDYTPATGYSGDYSFTYQIEVVNGPVVETHTATVEVTVNGSPDTEAPTVDVNPASTTFEEDQEVTITTNDTTATIYYTINGAKPEVGSTGTIKYSGAFTVSATTIVKAIAVDEAGNKSEVDTETYTKETDTEAPTVDVNPASTTFEEDQEVTITTNDTTATIYYTINGAKPEVGSTGTIKYSGAFTVSATTIVKAIAVDEAGNKSEVDTETYTKETDTQAPTVEINPASTTFVEDQEVTITTNDTTATIYYTINGAKPEVGSTGTIKYSGAFTVSATTIVKAIAVDEAGNKSEVDTETYTKETDTQAPTVEINPASTTFVEDQEVTITTNDTTATIYYTINGVKPEVGSTGTIEYGGAFTVSATITVKAIAVDEAGNKSETDTETYTLETDTQAPTVEINPTSTTFAEDQEVTITTNDTTATIYYTTNGADPVVGSTGTIEYGGAFTVSAATTTVKAIAVDEAGNKSETDTETYTLETDTQAPTVEINPTSTTFAEDQEVTITTNDTTATIYYTINGAIPEVGSAGTIEYGGAFTVSATTTVKAIAVDEAGKKSSIDTETYTLDTEAPTVDVNPASTTFRGTQTVSIVTDDTTAKVYYTTDGSEPTENSILYTGTFTVGTTTTIKAISVDEAGNKSTVDTETYTRRSSGGGGGGTTIPTTTVPQGTPEEDIFDDEVPLGSVEFYAPYIKGYPDVSFRPTRSISRIEMATIFARILNLEVDTAAEAGFSDVVSTHWGYKNLNAVAEIGLINGYVDGTFKPDKAMTRAEIATIISRYWDYVEFEADNADTVLVDSKEHWAYQSINELFNYGLITGFPDKTFRPDESLIREQVVVVINKLINRPEYNNPLHSFDDSPKTYWAYGNIEAATTYFEKSTGAFGEASTEGNPFSE